MLSWNEINQGINKMRLKEKEVVGIIGNIVIFYRQHPQLELRKIKI